MATVGRSSPILGPSSGFDELLQPFSGLSCSNRWLIAGLVTDLYLKIGSERCTQTYQGLRLEFFLH